MEVELGIEVSGDGGEHGRGQGRRMQRGKQGGRIVGKRGNSRW